jgi:NAD(P)-dependent dehydrogenase (short-subunit alcohol dehydrogenase family)
MTDQAIAGRTVVITGAASGIGRALALGFLKDGAKVVATDINGDGLSVARDAGAHVVQADITQKDDVDRVVAEAIAATGRLDVLFNNAGLGANTRIEALQPGSFEQFMAVHVYGALYGLQAALPQMRKQGYGRVINTLSRGAEATKPGWAAYGSAKAALFALTRIAASEVEGVDILINGMVPGPTQSGMMKGENLQLPEAVYPSALWMATLPADGPTGQVFWNKQPYVLFKDQIVPAPAA